MTSFDLVKMGTAKKQSPINDLFSGFCYLCNECIEIFLKSFVSYISKSVVFLHCDEGSNESSHRSPVLAGHALLCTAVLSLLYYCGNNGVALNCLRSSNNLVGGTEATSLESDKLILLVQKR